jgi:hypothetical protein
MFEKYPGKYSQKIIFRSNSNLKTKRTMIRGRKPGPLASCEFGLVEIIFNLYSNTDLVYKFSQYIANRRPYLGKARNGLFGLNAFCKDQTEGLQIIYRSS